MPETLVKRLADALEKAAGQYGPRTETEQNEWLALVLEARKPQMPLVDDDPDQDEG